MFLKLYSAVRVRLQALRRAIILYQQFLLQKAFKAAAKLPKKAQDILATLLLEELRSEKRWAETFKKSQDQLALLADEALAEFKG